MRVIPINQNAEHLNKDRCGSMGCFFHCLSFLLRFLHATVEFANLSAAELLPFVTASLEQGTDTMTHWRATVYAEEFAAGLAPDSYVTMEQVRYRTKHSADAAFAWVAQAFEQLDMLLVSHFTPLSEAVRAMFDEASGTPEKTGFLILCESKYSVLLKSAAGYMHFDSHTFSPCFLDSSAACEPRLQTEAAHAAHLLIRT